MKTWSMKVNQVLQLSVLVMGLCHAQRAPPSVDPSTSQEEGEVTVSQLRMLSLGLAHLMQGVDENAKRLEQQGDLVEEELDKATKSLESLCKHSLQARRTHRQVRKDLQILSARGDRLWGAVRDLQEGLEDLETEQGATQQRINWILQRLKGPTEPSLQGQLSVSSMKAIIDKQARRLAGLTSQVSARDRLINRRWQYIDRLEKEVHNNTSI